MSVKIKHGIRRNKMKYPNLKVVENRMDAFIKAFGLKCQVQRTRRKKKSLITEVVLLDPTDGYVVVGRAQKNKIEQLPKLLGRVIAKARAIKKYGWRYRKGRWEQVANN